MDVLHELERRYLYPDYPFNADEKDSEVWCEVSKLVCEGRFSCALETPECQAALGGLGRPKEAGVSVQDHFRRPLKEYLKDSGPERQHVVLCLGVSVLQLFARDNFTGPCSPMGSWLLETPKEEDEEEERRREALASIAGDSEGAYGLLRSPEYLLVAELVLRELGDDLRSCLTVEWWRLRCLVLHQKVLEETSTALYEEILETLERMEASPGLLGPGSPRDLRALFHLEAGYLHLLYEDVGRAVSYFGKAQETLEVHLELAGALGRRTRWQTEDRAQLVLKVEYRGRLLEATETRGRPTETSHLPEDVLLRDDTRLERPAFKEEDGDVVPELRPIEQAVILASVALRRRSSARDLQLDQETKSYLAALLQHPKDWSLQVSGLLLRSRVEAEETRAAERSLGQLEELVASVRGGRPPEQRRLALFHVSQVPPKWELERELGRVLLALGCSKSALEVFERLELWEEVVACYNQLGMRHRSAQVVRDLLKEDGESPKLWCMLGDATDDPGHYLKAWEISGRRSARAQRGLGDLLYAKGDFEAALGHYETSLGLNRLQLGVWRRAAFCAMRASLWSECARAYRTCAVLEPDAFESWNNLGRAYVELDQKPRAWNALREALRCRTDSWRLWDNFMAVSASLGRTSHALHAYGRILELKERHVDTQVLGRIVKALNDEGDDDEGATRLRKKCSEILGRLTVEASANAELWFLYGLLTEAGGGPQDHLLASQRFRKALWATTLKPGWERDALQVQAALFRAKHLLRATSKAAIGMDPKGAVAQLNSTKLAVQGAIVATRKGQVDVASGQVVQDVQEPLKEVQDLLDGLMERLQELKVKTNGTSGDLKEP